MKKRLTILIFLMSMACAVKEVPLPPVPLEEEHASKVREWEEYMGLIEEGEPSIETVLRLTAEYLEIKDLQYRRGMEEYERMLALYNSGQIKAPPREPVQEFSSLVRHFREIASRYRHGEGADAIRYILGYALYEQGERDEAAGAFEDLVKNYPNSGYIPEVSFRLGEFYFEKGDTGSSINAYGRVLDFQESVFYEKALYKMGWCYYRLDDFKRAVDAFMVIGDRRWGDGAKMEGLADEAVSSIVMALSRFKDMDEAMEYVRRKGFRGYMPLVLERLGERLADEERYYEALSVHKHRAELVPDGPGLPFIYDRMARIYEHIGDADSALRTRWEMVAQFNPAAPWYRKNHPSGSEDVDRIISKIAAPVSKRYHQRWKMEGDPRDIEKAVKGYRIFLTSFRRPQDIKEAGLLLAEALFDAKRYREAALEYEKIADSYGDAERGDIVYSAFLAHEMMFSQSPGHRKDTLRSLERLLGAYRADLSKEGRLERVIYRMADMYSMVGEYGKAREVLAGHAKGKDDIRVYGRIAELYVSEGNLIAAEEVYAGLAAGSSAPALRETLAQVRYGVAEEYLKEGRESDASLKFDQSFSASPGSKVGEAALTRLGHIHIKNGDMDGLVKTVRRLVGAYPGSGGAVPLLAEGGRILEKIEPLKAAGLYEYASSIASDREGASRLMFAAGILYDEGGYSEKAVESLKVFLRSGRVPVEDEAEAMYRVGRILLRGGRRGEGEKMLNGVMGMKGKVNDRIIAETSLLLLKGKQVPYMDYKLAPPFEKTLRKKTRLLDDLLREYSDVARYGYQGLLPEVFYHMGMLLENFRDSVLHSERPRGLTEEELEEYKFLLEERAYPYEEQAVNAYEKVLQAGRERMIYNEWVEGGLKRLASLRPALYNRVFDGKGVEALALLRQGRYEDALKVYQRIADRAPGDPYPYKEMGIIYEIYLGDMGKAVESYSSYLAKGGEMAGDVGAWMEVAKARLLKEEGQR